MTPLEKVKKEVLELPKREYNRFRDWFLEHDWKLWDKELAADVKAGRLDFLVEEARKEKNTR
jgi:hypothetical protein